MHIGKRAADIARRTYTNIIGVDRIVYCSVYNTYMVRVVNFFLSSVRRRRILEIQVEYYDFFLPSSLPVSVSPNVLACARQRNSSRALLQQQQLLLPLPLPLLLSCSAPRRRLRPRSDHAHQVYLASPERTHDDVDTKKKVIIIITTTTWTGASFVYT